MVEQQTTCFLSSLLRPAAAVRRHVITEHRATRVKGKTPPAPCVTDEVEVVSPHSYRLCFVLGGDLVRQPHRFNVLSVSDGCFLLGSVVNMSLFLLMKETLMLFC